MKRMFKRVQNEFRINEKMTENESVQVQMRFI